MLTPEQRSLRARMAAYAKASMYDGTEATRAARDKFLARFEDQVDPDRRLPEAERQRRALAARRAYMSGLALKSAKARSRRAA